ncbi:MAG: IS200/IS605 family transposase [Candidatus Hodarchaeota archaeon]
MCVTKYRKNVFEPEIATRLKQLVVTLSTAYEVTLIEQEIDQAHIHILFSCSPTLTLPKYIRILKSSPSKSFRQKFPQIHQQLWDKAFWSPSYFLATTGQVKLDVIRQYVENQGKP